MVYGTGNQMIKFLVFIANLLIFLFGGLIFGFSLWANLDGAFSSHLKDLASQVKADGALVNELSQYQSSLWALTAAGALLFIVGFLGCCGAACESLICLTLFFVIVAVLSLIELFALVILFTNRGDLLTTLHKILAESAQNVTARKSLRPIQTTLNCCGATAESAFMYRQEGLCYGVPENVEDCYTALSGKLESMGEIVIGIGIILMIIQAFALIFSCVLCRAFRERAITNYYD